jgi:hypothetical protein
MKYIRLKYNLKSKMFKTHLIMVEKPVFQPL